MMNELDFQNYYASIVDGVTEQVFDDDKITNPIEIMNVFLSVGANLLARSLSFVPEKDRQAIMEQAMSIIFEVSMRLGGEVGSIQSITGETADTLGVTPRVRAVYTD